MSLNRRMFAATAALVVACLVAPTSAGAATKSELQTKSKAALESLLAQNVTAKELVDQARGILIFPEIIKGGLIVGGQYGQGVLYKGDEVASYHNIAGASFGLQFGGQTLSQAFFFMTDEALDYLKKSKGFEIGGDVDVAVVDDGLGKDLGTSTAKDSIMAFVFGQEGLMAGVSLKGSKITEINPDD